MHFGGGRLVGRLVGRCVEVWRMGWMVMLFCWKLRGFIYGFLEGLGRRGATSAIGSGPLGQFSCMGRDLLR
jgi:hypothetical protein